MKKALKMIHLPSVIVLNYVWLVRLGGSSSASCLNYMHNNYRWRLDIPQPHELNIGFGTGTENLTIVIVICIIWN